MDSFVKSQMLVQDFEHSVALPVSGSGNKTWAAAVSLKGYQVIETKVVTDLKGKEKVSTSNIYFDGVDILTIKEGDKIEIVSSGTIFPVIKIELFYKAQNQLDYGVVYL